MSPDNREAQRYLGQIRQEMMEREERGKDEKREEGGSKKKMGNDYEIVRKK